MQALKVNDQVQHVTGGSMMLVEAVNGDRVTCVWRVGQETKREEFPAAQLKPYSAAPRVRYATFRKGFD